MYSLFIDTHSSNIVICLFKDGKLLKKEEKESVNQHSVFTLPMIRSLLALFSLSVSDLGEILVVNGPGSFTGVRIGVTIAKTMAYSLNIPIKVIDSLVVKAVNIDSDVKYVSLVDRHGAYIGSFDSNNSLIDKFRYVGNKEYDELSKINTYISNIEIDYEKVYEYSKTINSVNAHSANPLYVKNVDGLND